MFMTQVVSSLRTNTNSHIDEATETVINDVDQQDRLAEVAADGSFTLKLNGKDNVIVDLTVVGSGHVEEHILAI